MIEERIARWEGRLRPLLVRLPTGAAVALYSWGRGRFLSRLSRRLPAPVTVPESLSRDLWGLRFRSPLLNAAGVFKTGEGYGLAVRQGAGGYLAGTTTAKARAGNRRRGIALPFVPYPRSAAASNWLGLPNPGHGAVAARLEAGERRDGCPIGASVATCPDPEMADDERLEALLLGMRLYDQAGIGFLELNESCPNTGEVAAFDAMERRLGLLAERFLEQRRRALPVVVKFSCDTEIGLVARLVALLSELGFDGVNFGNSSTDYAVHRAAIDPSERRLFDGFRRRYGGGLSGRPLKAASLALAKAAIAARDAGHSPRELHVVRTGGIEDTADVRASLAAGVSLCQWYTGYFERFARHGHRVYEGLYSDLTPSPRRPSG